MSVPPPAGFAAAFVPLTEVTRAGVAESVHMGAVAVVDRDGTLLYQAGDAQVLTYTRSALKPLQALPFAAAGGVRRFGLESSELALLCASHSGEERHIRAASAILAKAGNEVGDLKCGTHAPRHFEIRGELPPAPPYSPLAHNCSGKHAGMLAHCVACGSAKENYLDPDHPLQAEIRTAVARFTGMGENELVMAIDGCSAPNYALPLSRLAYAYARLASADTDPDYGRAPRELADAMIAHPEMVSGEGRADLVLATAGRGDWVAKVGAEGVQAIGIRSRGWGIALKVADGNARGLHPATVGVLEQLGLLDASARSALAELGRPVIRNCRGIPTGGAHATVVLDKVA